MSTIGSVNWEPESFDFDEYVGVTPLGRCIAEQSWDELEAEDYERDMSRLKSWNDGIDDA